MQEGSLSSISSPTFIVCRFFDDGYSNWCEVTLYCNFDLHFSNYEQCGPPFHVFIGYLYDSGEMSVQVFSSFSNWTFVFLILSCMSCYIFWRLILCQLFHLQLFSSIWSVAFHLFYCFLCCFSATELCPSLCDPMWQHTRLPCPSPSVGDTQTNIHWVVMPSNHLVLCCPLLLLPSISPSIRVFSKESVLHIRWTKYWSFSFSISLSSE